MRSSVSRARCNASAAMQTRDPGFCKQAGSRISGAPRARCTASGIRRSVLLLGLLACLSPAHAQAPDTILLNGKLVRYDAPPAAGAGGARRQDRGDRRLGRHPRAGRPRHPRHRSRRPHRHPRPDRFPHPRHPRRPHLHHRGALDRRPHAGRGARPPPRHGRHRAEGIVAGGRRRLDRAAVRGGPPADPGRDRRPPRPIITSMSSSSTARVLLDPGGYDALGIARDPDLAARVTVERDGAGQPTGWLTGDNRAISDLFNLLPRPTFAQKVEGTRAFFRALNAVGLTGVLDPGGYNLPIADYQPLFQVWRERGLTVARALQPVRAAPRPRARGFQGADAGAADGLRRRMAALQRHRRERHLGHVQQRHADRRAEGAARRRAALGGVARHDRDVPLAQRPRGASSARRAGARQRRDAGRKAALVDRASQRRLARQPHAHEGDGARLAHAERVLLPRRGVPRPARRRGRARRRRRSSARCGWACRSAAAPTRTG